MVTRHTTDSSRRVVPRLLVQEEPLVDQIERPTLPRVAAEAILRQRLDTARTVGVAPGLSCIGG
jgi:hypothetical protein